MQTISKLWGGTFPRNGEIFSDRWIRHGRKRIARPIKLAGGVNLCSKSFLQYTMFIILVAVKLF